MTNPYAKFEVTMSKKFFVAFATALVLANGTSTVFATNGSNSDSSGSSTTLLATSNSNNNINNRLTDDQKAAQKKLEQAVKNANIAAHNQDVILFKAELRAYLVKRAEIDKAFNIAIADAGKSFNTALKSANTYPARKVAREAFITASKIARQIYQNALKDLGAAPAKPGKP